MRQLIVLVSIACILIGASLLYKPHAVSIPASQTSTDHQTGTASVTDYKDAIYTIDGHAVKLANGTATEDTGPGSASQITTRYFGNEAYADLDGDGRKDVAFLLTQESGGSGTFFYIVVALNKQGGYVGSNAFLLGDRIAPQTTEIGTDGSIILNYADRAPNEPMSARPSVGKTLRLKFDAMTNSLMPYANP